MPTHNGERYIREALDSLLAQDYPNFEILISDNASTDATPDIIREYADRDARIRVVRHDANIGAPANFNFVFHETTGSYFMWAADDDRWEPSYVSACVRALEAEPRAVLACTRIRFMDEAGRDTDIDEALHDNPDLRMTSVADRVRLLLSRAGWYQMYGVIRREVLAETRLAGNAYGADVVLSSELAMRGQLARIPDRLFHFRLFAEGRAEPDRGPWHEGVAQRDRVSQAPYTHLQEAVAGAISASALPRRQMLEAWLGMARAVFMDRTPMRSRIADESGARLRMAVRDHDGRAALKYTLLSVAVASYRAISRLRRRGPGSSDPSHP